MSMTCVLAAKCDKGVVVASDSQVTVGSTQLNMKYMKGNYVGDMFILYAGTLSTVQRVLARAATRCMVPSDFQTLLWEQAGKMKKDAAEYLVVYDGCISLFSNYGEVLGGYDYACAGSEWGWMGLDLLMPDLRNPTYTNVKNKLLKVLRGVERRDTGVGRPLLRGADSMSPLEQQARKDVNWYVELADGNWYKAQAMAAKDAKVVYTTGARHELQGVRALLAEGLPGHVARGMTGPDILFSTIVVVGFAASALDHHFYGKREFHKPVRALYLGCVIAIDLWLA